jgi:hypothetical protein
MPRKSVKSRRAIRMCAPDWRTSGHRRPHFEARQIITGQADFHRRSVAGVAGAAGAPLGAANGLVCQRIAN